MVDVSAILEKVSSLLGQKVYDTHLGVGSMVTIEFGVPLVDSWPRGEWSLWLYFCEWRLELPNGVIVASEDEREDIRKLMKQLVGMTLVKMQISAPSLDTTLKFEQNIVLRLFPTHTESDSDMSESWMLFTPDLHVLALGPGATWVYEKSLPL